MRNVSVAKYDPAFDIAYGEYSAAYFDKTRRILFEEQMTDTVTMQVFQKKEAVLAGMECALATIKGSIPWDWPDLEVWALNDGDRIKPWETVMTITGPLVCFALLESVYLGILREATTVATNMTASLRRRTESQWCSL